MRKSVQNLIGIVAIILVVSSCQYKFIVEPVPPPPPPGDTISFQNDILPIWNDGNYCTACHKAGGQKPDLTPDNAYNSIMGMSGVVVTSDPSSSLIYLFPSPSNTKDHTWKKYKTGDDAIVLQWIEQGAMNN